MTVDIATLAIRIDSLEARTAARDMDRMRDAGSRAEQSASSLEAATRKLQGALAILGIGAGLGSIIRMADEYTKFTAQLRLATQSQREYAAAVDDVRRIANTAQQDLAATGVLYARIANGTRELGVTQQQVAKITEVVNLALKVSGATASESASAMLQLSQSFASGTLRGEEFNAVNEAAPRLMKALADNMGVPIGALKKMAEEGAITSKIMASVLPQALQQLQEESKRVQTISGAFTVLTNKVMELTAVKAEANGMISLLTGSIGALAENLTLITGIVTTLTATKLATWLGGAASAAHNSMQANRALLTSNLAAAEANVVATAAAHATATARERELRASVLAAQGVVALAITENGLIPAQARAAAAAEAHAAALTTQAAAARAASIGMGVLRSAMTFLGGPLGAIVTLLGLAATAWMVWGRRAEEGNKQAAESFDEAHARIIKGLDEQIAKNEKLIQMQKLGVTKDKAEKDMPIVDQMKRYSALLNDINNRAGEYAPGKGKSETDVLLDRLKVMKQITEESQKLQKRNETDDQSAAFGPAAQALAAVRERLSGVNKQYLDDLKALQSARAANAIGEKEYISLVSKLATETWNASDAGKDLAASSKAQLDARLEAIKASIDRDKNLRTEGVARVTELNRQGLASDAEVYSAKHAAALAAGKDAAAIFNAEIAALSAYNGKDAAARIANNAKIKDLGVQRTEALRSASVAAEQLRTAYEYDKDKPARDAAAASQKEIVAINDQIDATERQIAAYNKLPSVVTMATVALLEEQKAALSGIEGSEKAVADIDTKIAAYSRLAQAQKSLQGLETGTDVAKAEQLLKILQAVDDAARQAAQGMTDSFGRVGTAIGGLTTALTGYAVQQQAIAAQLAAVKADPKSDAQKISQAEIAASRASAQAQIKSYGDMASSAKGFFSENSKGYKVLEATEKAFRAYEMALALESMAKKIFFKEGEVAANVALNATKLTGEAATTAASTGLAATEASAWGITAVVKAIASLPFPLNLAAGAATLAAVVAIGAKVMGSVGSGQSASQQRQDSAGTGSILGDSSAKSESIARAIALTAENSNIELSYTAAMAASLRSIDSSIAGLGNLLIRTTGLTSETTIGGYSSTTKALNSDGANAAAGFAYGTLVGGPVLGVVAGLASVALNKLLGSTGEKITNAIFGGKTTAQDTGLYVSTTTLGNLVNGGANVNQYTDIKKDGGLFSSDKYSTTHTQLGTEINAQFSKVFASLYDTVVAGANLLGVGGDEFTDKLYKLVVSIPEISTKGLTGEQIQKQLETVFSKVGDDIARFGVDGLSQFQKVGEGYLETLVRVASNYANLDSILAASGTTFGQTGMASIAARERLIALTGGIDKLASQQSGFNDNFLTQAERLAPVQKYVTDQLAAMGLQSLDTRDKFKEYTLGLANSGALATEAGAKQYAALLALSEAFAKTHAATVDLTKSEQEIADERAELQKKYNELTMTSAQLREEERKAVADANKGLFDMVSALTALNDAQEAYDKAVSSAEAAMKTAAGQYQAFVDNVTSAQTKFDAAVKAIRDEYAKALEADNKAAAAVKSERDKITDGYVAATEKVAAAQQKMVDSFLKLNTSLADFITTLDTTDLAGKSGAEQQAALESQFAILAAQARAGDIEAGGQLPEIAKNLLTIGKANSASALDFASLVADVRNTIGSVQAVAAGKIGDGKASDESSDLEKALAEQELWAQAVKDSGASFTKASDDLLKGYKDAVSAQQSTGVALEYWSKVAQATGISLVQTKSELATTGDALIKGFYDAQKALAIAQIELTAANAIKGGLEFRQTSALENFVTAIKDVNTTGKAASDAAAALFEAASNKLLAGSEAAIKAQQVAKDGMTYWGSVVTSSAAGIAASVQAMATAAQAIAAAQASAAAAQQAASGYASSKETMVRTWYANNSQYQAAGGKTTQVEVDYWLRQLMTRDATDVKRDFALAAARDAGYTDPLDISKFATGGAFTNGVVSRPTNFDIGQMGEEGSEAIMPLANVGGRLGVRVVGASNAELLPVLRAIQAELAQIRADQRTGDAANVSATKEQTRLLRDVTEDGTALLTKEATA